LLFKSSITVCEPMNPVPPVTRMVSDIVIYSALVVLGYIIIILLFLIVTTRPKTKEISL
jgi:hypothetical protein